MFIRIIYVLEAETDISSYRSNTPQDLPYQKDISIQWNKSLIPIYFCEDLGACNLCNIPTSPPPPPPTPGSLGEKKRENIDRNLFNFPLES